MKPKVNFYVRNDVKYSVLKCANIFIFTGEISAVLTKMKCFSNSVVPTLRMEPKKNGINIAAGIVEQNKEQESSVLAPQKKKD